MYDLTYADAVEKAEHFIALGQTNVWLRDETDFPWDKAFAIDNGGSYRLNGPSSFYVLAADAGLTLRLSVEFESRDANGRGVSLFDRDRLREVARKLPASVRAKFALFLREKVLPAMAERTAEIRAALGSQADSEDCVRGLISFAESDGPLEGQDGQSRTPGMSQ